MTHSSVEIQTSQKELPKLPEWFGEVALIATHLKKEGLLQAICRQVQLVRARMGDYEVIDFVAVLIGYSLSGEPTLKDFYERLTPFASPFMALFERDRLPHRSTLSRFLAAVSPHCVAQLRRLFEQDLLARPLAGVQQAGLWDRCGRQWQLFDVDGTRAVARQRALPHSKDLPKAVRRLDEVCAKGYAGRKRGEVLRTRTVVQHASTHLWLGTFAGKGNGDYEQELKEALQVIHCYVSRLGLSPSHSIVRLDGLYGTTVVVALLVQAALGWIMRGKDYSLLQHEQVQARLKLAPDHETVHPETGTQRQLYDVADLALGAPGTRSRVIVAVQEASASKSRVGKSIEGRVYELFFTNLPQNGFLPADVLSLYFGRGGFETTLCDEDQEQDPDRWCSQTPDGQGFWQILSQWMWNLRTELGQLVQPSPLRTTELAPAQFPLPHWAPGEEGPAPTPAACALGEEGPALALDGEALLQAVAALGEEGPVLRACRLQLPGYGPPSCARPLHPGLYGAQDFLPQADGTLRCPAGQVLRVRMRRKAPGGTLRVYYSAQRAACQTCDLRTHCLRGGKQGQSPRHVSLLYQPADQEQEEKRPSAKRAPPACVGTLPLLYRDWPRCGIRRAWMGRLRCQTVTLTLVPAQEEVSAQRSLDPPVLTLAQRKHWRLSWQERLLRNASAEGKPRLRLHLFGIPEALASTLGLPSSR